MPLYGCTRTRTFTFGYGLPHVRCRWFAIYGYVTLPRLCRLFCAHALLVPVLRLLPRLRLILRLLLALLITAFAVGCVTLFALRSLVVYRLDLRVTVVGYVCLRYVYARLLRCGWIAVYARLPTFYALRLLVYSFTPFDCVAFTHLLLVITVTVRVYRAFVTVDSVTTLLICYPIYPLLLFAFVVTLIVAYAFTVDFVVDCLRLLPLPFYYVAFVCVYARVACVVVVVTHLIPVALI